MHMYKIGGGCYCGSVELSAELSRAPASYQPRACDCDFCRKHGAAYISDPAGHLRIKLAEESVARRYRQGSGAAEFLLCANCGVLVTVLYRVDQVTYAAVNTRATDEPTAFGEPDCVSPKTLPPADKIKRWLEIWFSNVEISVRV